MLPHAIKSELNFNRIKCEAESIGMKVNSEKTQLVCISGNPTINVKSYIRPGSSQEIQSGEELKILGFWFGTSPNVDVHVRKLEEKFRARLWSMRHLKRSGMTSSDLLITYISVLRPVLDYAAPAYHSLLSVGQTKKLESLQKRALKIVYGVDISYAEALALANITTLEERRLDLTKRFAIKTQLNTRFTDGWFPQKPAKPYSTRSNRPFREDKVRTERMKKKPFNIHEKIIE